MPATAGKFFKISSVISSRPKDGSQPQSSRATESLIDLGHELAMDLAKVGLVGNLEFRNVFLNLRCNFGRAKAHP